MTHAIYYNIKRIRELKDYTQEYMALNLGLTQAGYSKIESGNGNVKLKYLLHIAEIFEIKIEDIIRFEPIIVHVKIIESIPMVSKDSFPLNLKLQYEKRIILLEEHLKKKNSKLQII